MSETRSSLVVVPFLAEDPYLVARTYHLAVAHPAVAEVIGVHGSDETTVARVQSLAPAFRTVPQERIGLLRPGKGDAVNTGFDYFLASGLNRLHFFDADIKTFDATWIEDAEVGLDHGFDTVRHFYPRAATDGMITAMLTRPGMAMLWPHSVLSRIKQPLSGEVAFTRHAVELLVRESGVREQSDWGIDTVITVSSSRLGLSLFENFVSAGKDHKLYDGLDDLETMLDECLHALQRLRTGTIPKPIAHHVGLEKPPAASLTRLVAFDAARSLQLLGRPLTREGQDLMDAHFNPTLARAGRSDLIAALDTATWLEALRVLITRAEADNSGWMDVAFRLWVGRVLHYTRNEVPKGYEHAAGYIDDGVALAMLHPLN